MNEDQIRWGIIGCGNVTEVKSGPAFNKVPGSQLVAVMRRDAEKAADYALRHGVPKWYSDAGMLVNDPYVNAVYIATPPSTHAFYTKLALAAGKPVYVEKPMALNAQEAMEMESAAAAANLPLAVAHYRRAQPLYLKVKELVGENVIGRIRHINLRLHKPQNRKSATSIIPWRVDPAVSGGGLFHDLAPHQLDIIYWIFGKATDIEGLAMNQSRLSYADDLVRARLILEGNILFNGEWDFTDTDSDNVDSCEIIGDSGSIIFSFFDHRPVQLLRSGTEEEIHFEKLAHVQQPMIEKVVKYFLQKGANPCTASDGVYVMQLIDQITKHS